MSICKYHRPKQALHATTRFTLTYDINQLLEPVKKHQLILTLHYTNAHLILAIVLSKQVKGQCVGYDLTLHGNHRNILEKNIVSFSFND